MVKLRLQAEKRKAVGRKVKALRRAGILPANIYGKGIKSRAVQVDLKSFTSVFKEAGETGLVDLRLDKEKIAVLIHNVQKEPVSDGFVHADLLQVNLKEKVTAQIPVELVGESPVEKQGLGTVVNYVSEVEVEALPMDLPEKFEVDLSKLTKVDDLIEVRDLKVDSKKVEIKESADTVLVKVEPPREEEEEPEIKVEEGVEGEEGKGKVEGAVGEKDEATEDEKEKKL